MRCNPDISSVTVGETIGQYSDVPLLRDDFHSGPHRGRRSPLESTRSTIDRRVVIASSPVPVRAAETK